MRKQTRFPPPGVRARTLQLQGNKSRLGLLCLQRTLAAQGASFTGRTRRDGNENSHALDTALDPNRSSCNYSCDY